MNVTKGAKPSNVSSSLVALLEYDLDLNYFMLSTKTHRGHKSPSIDGMRIELYKVLSEVIGSPLLLVWNESKRYGSLTYPSMKAS